MTDVNLNIQDYDDINENSLEEEKRDPSNFSHLKFLQLVMGKSLSHNKVKK